MSDAPAIAGFVRSLLPPLLWQRDAEQGGVLAALIDAVAQDYDRLRGSIDAAYDDLFIATCDPRFVPLIAADIGLAGLAPYAGPGVGERALVGRAIEVRRDKGTAAALARAVQAATGWAAYVNDDVRCVGRTAGLSGPPAAPDRLIDLADRRAVAELGQPWSTTARRPVIHGRPMAPGSGSADGPAPDGVSVGIWRLLALPMLGRTPRAAVDGPDGAYRCDPLGHDVALFDGAVEAPDEARLPRPLSVAELADAIEAGRSPVVVWLGDGDRDGRPRRARLAAADLSAWRRPAGSVEVLVDPTTGRLMMGDAATIPAAVDYVVGAAGEIGGGPFAATGDLAAPAPAIAVWTVGDAGGAQPTLAAALDAWTSAAPEEALIELGTGATQRLPEDGLPLVLGHGQRLRIWARDGVAPVLDGHLAVTLADGAGLDLRGVTVGGRLTAAGPGAVSMSHVTVVPRRRRRRVLLADEVALTAVYCVLGGVHGGRRGPASVGLTACIVDGAITGLREPTVLHLEQVTVLGKVKADTVIAEDVLFAKGVRLGDAESSVIRTSFVPQQSRSDALIECIDETYGRVAFTSTRWSEAGFAQLSLAGAAALLTGGSEGAEIGAFHWLDQPARLRRLTVVVPAMLPAGLQASIQVHT